MFVPFLYELRARKVPVGTQEAVALARGARARACTTARSTASTTWRARSACTREAHLDAFDQAFLAHFKGVEREALELTRRSCSSGCKDAEASAPRAHRRGAARCSSSSTSRSCSELFEERLREQKERHDGGNRWIGTGGTSPFGHGGAAREGIRVGGGGRQALARCRSPTSARYRRYRDDVMLDIAADRGGAAQAARLRARGRRRGARPRRDHRRDREERRRARDGDAPAAPAQHARDPADGRGRLDGPVRASWCRACSAPRSKATHFKELRTYYFHNCVYGSVYKDRALQRAGVACTTCSHECGPHYKLDHGRRRADGALRAARARTARRISARTSTQPGIGWLHDARRSTSSAAAGSTPSPRTTGRATPSRPCARCSRCSRSRSTAWARPWPT